MLRLKFYLYLVVLSLVYAFFPSIKYTFQSSFPSPRISMDGWFGRIKTTADRCWEVKAIGCVQSPYIQKYNVPKQATISQRNDTFIADGKLLIFEEYKDCLYNVEGFDYIWAITLMHINSGFKTKVRPQPVADAENKPPQQVGLFASRAPHRPNPIALSALKVISVNMTEGSISVQGLDLLDDTPILDIKPYVPAFDAFPDARAGWMDLIRSNSTEARIGGYQTIRSSRGARATRSKERQRQQQQQRPPKELSTHTNQNENIQ
jgi:tRNA (adenine37-N6)-methyltransferase